MATKNTRRRPATAGKRRRWLLPLILFLASFLPVLAVYFCLFVPLAIPAAGYRLEIPRGESMYSLSNKMAADGLLRSDLLARAWIKLHPRLLSKLRPGIYLVQGPLTAVQLLQKLGSLEPVNRLTVVEGTTFHALLATLAQRPDLTHELAGKSDSEIMAALELKETYPEGLFAPDTYDIAPGDSDAYTLKRLYQRQQKLLEQAWAGRAPDLPYRNAYEALIMASIVEKETGAAAERPKIAGVFLRRLRTRMRLQTDPTVIYGLGLAYDGHLSRADLQNPTPYNTYVIDGLPPTPIALPGQAAIQAALHPADGDSFYFVARGDGTHQFSATLAEQSQAVREYQLHRVEGYHSAPAGKP
jgi:UPF0755 protein